MKIYVRNERTIALLKQKLLKLTGSLFKYKILDDMKPLNPSCLG